MNCEQIRQNLLAYLDGEVGDVERQAIETHLASCAGCAEALERLQALQSGLHTAVPTGLAQVRLSSAASARIRERLQGAQRAHRQRGLLGGMARLLRLRLALAKAAIPLTVVLFLVATALFGTQPLTARAQETVVVAPDVLAPGTDAALRVIVREPASAQPIPGAEIDVRLRPQGGREVVLYSGRTDPNGTADVRFGVPDYAQDDVLASLIVTAESGQGRDQVIRQVTVRRSYRAYLTSDKPLYQPGQTIHLRVLALDTAQGLPAAGRTVRLIVQGPDGDQLLERAVRASDYGIAAADCALSPHAPDGTYRLIAALGDTVSTRTVTVGRYERPRFRVEVTADRRYVLPKETVSGQVLVRLLNGQPLPQAEVSVRATLRDPRRQRSLATVHGRTDANGDFFFSLTMPEVALIAEQANLVLEASATDESEHVGWAGQVIPAAVEPLAIDVVAEGGRLRPGVDNTVYLLTARPDGTPARTTLQVGVAGEPFELITDAYGLALFRFVPAPGVREVQVQVVARDEAGRTAGRMVTLSADQGPAQVLLRLDRAAYEVGEVMHLEVLAGQEARDVVYVDVTRRDGGQTLGTYLARLRDGRAQLDVDVSPEMAGTLEVHAYQVLPDGALVRDARLAVVDARAEITVAIQPDLSAYRPGDTARVSVDTRLDGAAVQSAVGIAVVDESVFALEARAPGFAKLFFLLEASLLDLDAHPQGVSLPDLIDPPADGARDAQDTAARAAWANLPAGQVRVERSVASQGRPSAWLWPLGLSLGTVLLCIPLALWGIVLERLRRARLFGASLWRTSLLLVGGAFVFLIPATAAVAIGVHLILGPALGRAFWALLVVAWSAALLALGVDAWRRRDHSAQFVVLLVGAYGVLGALLGTLAERGGDLGGAFVAGIAAALIPALAALLLLAAGLWLERRRGAAALIVLLVLLSVAVVVVAGMTLQTSSLFSQAIASPTLYAGPLSWFTGCAAAPSNAPKEGEAVSETAEVEKQVTQVAEVQTSPTPIPTATAPPAPTTQPARPTASIQPQPMASPPSPSTDTPPPPLLGQFVPETIYWLPEAITDPAGHLEMDIPLPDGPATWRLTALASTRQGQLGAATALLHVAP